MHSFAPFCALLAMRTCVRSPGAKGRFRKRVVLANVPSFRLSFRGNICQNHPFGNHPFANPQKERKRTQTLRVACLAGVLRGNRTSNSERKMAL